MAPALAQLQKWLPKTRNDLKIGETGISTTSGIMYVSKALLVALFSCKLGLCTEIMTLLPSCLENVFVFVVLFSKLLLGCENLIENSAWQV